MSGSSLLRTASVARKEFLHILRDPQTLFFVAFLPVLELFMLGYAIDTNVRHVRTGVVDYAGTQESRRLLERFENSQDFKIVARAASETELSHMIVAGTARVGIVVPRDYSERLESGQTATILVAVDGSESSVATAAVNLGNSIALRDSLERALGGKPLPVEARPRVLFNPDTRSANFFLPGLLIVMCQIIGTTLAANAIVREKEMGTLEQLFMTPIRRGELIVGKMLPYVAVTTAEFCFIAALMHWAMFVPVHGNFLTLLALSLPFTAVMLGLGLLISTRAESREAAGQMAMGTVLPSIFLSGYVFPLDSLPRGFDVLSRFIPTTWMIDASRGVVLRGAGWAELWPNGLALLAMAAVATAAASLKMRKQLA